MSGADPAEDPKDTENPSVLAIRLSPELLARVDELYESIRDDVPWINMTRSDLVRWVLTVELQRRGFVA